jgi:glucoamylase
MTLRTCTLVSLLAAFAAGSPFLARRQSSLDDFVKKEKAIALQGAINNIGGHGSPLVPGADPGIVVASPSTDNPNYFYTWTRDSALVYTMLIDEYINGDESIQYLIEDYIPAQAYLQTVTNPSGSLYPAGLGLAEPKFYTNKTRFNGDWGRPQRDGPALRAIALIDYSNFLLKIGEKQRVKNVIWPIILNDLIYVGQYWNQVGYDAWEEVRGYSFFTVNSQHRALVQGSLLADKLGQNCAACGQAPEILCFLSTSFWNATGGYLSADINVNNVNRSGINTDQILGSIHVFGLDASCDAKGKSLAGPGNLLRTHIGNRLPAV